MSPHLLICAFSLVVWCSVAVADDYKPMLPKTSTTESILVVDLQGMNGDDFRDFEAQVACQAIQGIVNRTSPRKIYLTGASFAFRHEGEMDHWALKNNLLPVPTTKAELDRKKRFPALSYLLTHFHDQLQGSVRYRDITGQAGDKGGFVGDSGSFCAALTVAGQLDVVPVTPRLEEALKQDGFELPNKADTSALKTRIEAHRWARDQYFTKKTTRAYIGKYNLGAWGGQSPTYMSGFLDYYIATRAFVLCLDGTIAEEAQEVKDFLVPERYRPGTPVVGDSNGEGEEIHAIHRAGHVFIFAPRPTNFSVYASFPSDPRRLTPAPKPVATPVDPKGVYVAFYLSEGDNMAADVGYHHDGFVNASPLKHKVPIAFTFSPLMLDVFPTYVEWRTKNDAGGQVELMIDPIDGVYPDGDEAYDNYAAWVRYYLDNDNDAYAGISILEGPHDPKAVALAKRWGALFNKLGYQGGVHPCDFQAHNDGQIVITHPAGSTADGASSEEIEACARITAEKTPEGQPGFVLICGGDGTGFDNLKMHDAMRRLQSDPRGRNFHFVKPSQLAMQFLAWKGHVKPKTAETKKKIEAKRAEPGKSLERDGWYVTASAVGYHAEHPYFAVDGKLETRYTKSGQQPGDWYQIDLGAKTKFDRVTVDLHPQTVGDFIRGYELFVSNDGKKWGASVASGEGQRVEQLEIKFPAQEARYLKLQMTGTAAGSNFSISEIQVYHPK